MTRTKQTRLGIGALALGILLWQVGCQSSEAPAGEESADASGSAPFAAPRSVTLAAGTPLKVRMTTGVSTESHKAGDSFVATLEEPVLQNNQVIAPKGATVSGRVAEADPGGRVRGVAHLTIELTSLKSQDGQTVEIATNRITVEAQTTKKEDATKIAIGTGIGAAVGAIAGGGKGAAIGAGAGAGAGTGVVLATRGDAAAIGSETVLNFQLRSPITISGKS